MLGGVRHFALFAIPLWTCLAHAIEPTALEEARIAISIQPGEPGAPSEEIFVSLAKGKHFLSFQVRSREKLTNDVVRPISAEEFLALWDLVKRHKLRAWLPDENPSDALDFGETRLRIEWRSTATPKPLVHDVAWTQPLRNEEPVKELIKGFSELAKRHLGDVKPLFIR